MIELVILVLVGCLLGVITGLVPGIHVNTIAVIALEVFRTGRFELAALIVAMSIVHTFVDFIPSIVLAVPGEDNLLSVLPGQRFFLGGKGHYAIMLTVWGGLIGGIIAILVSPVFLRFLQNSIELLGQGIPIILLGVLGLMVFDEKGIEKKAWAIGIITLSSLLGIFLLSPSSAVKNSLLVLVLGFFGAAPLLHSLRNKPVAREQRFECKGIKSKKAFEGSVLGVLGASFVSMLPGIGPNQAALIVRTLFGKISSSSYLVLIGGINTANMFFSLIALYAIGKTRTGTAVAIKQLVELQLEHIFILIAVCLIAISFGAIATVVLSKKILAVVGKIEYGKANKLVLAFLVALVFVLSNPLGVIAFAVSTAIGFGAMCLGLKRSHCMAFLMAPTIIYYLFH